MSDRGIADRNRASASSRNERTKRVIAALLGSTILAYGIVSAPLIERAAAQQASRAVQFSIPAQPLSSAIDAFSRATGWQVGYSSDIARSTTSRAVSGAMTPAQALQTMVAGTGVSVSVTGPTSAALVSANAGSGGTVAADGSMMLETITVQGTNPNSTIGNLLEPYAGGQVATGGQVGMLGNRSVMNTPFSVTNYTKKKIEDQQARTLSDVLSNEPSVVTSTGGATEISSFRGFLSQTYTAGHSLNGLPSMSPMNSPNTDWIERVEVLRGPSALLKGAAFAPQGPIGGSVNLVTKKAGEEPLTQVTTRYMSDSQFGTHVDFGRRFGDNKQFGIRFNGSLDGGHTPVDTQRAQSGNAAINLDYRGDRVRLSADFLHQSQKLTAPTSYVDLFNVIGGVAKLTSIPKAPSTSTALLPSWTKIDHKVTLGMVQGEVDVLDNVTAYGAIGKQIYESYANLGNVSLLNSSGAIGIRSKPYRERMETLSMLGGIRANADTGTIAHALSLDLSRVQYTMSDTGQNRATTGVGPLIPAGTLYNPDFSLFSPSGDLGDPIKLNTITASSFGVADTLSILDERIQVTAGVRYQEIGIEYFGGSGTIFQEDYNASTWSPSLAVVVKPWENVSLYANYIENLQPGTNVTSTYANAGEAFPPYKSRQYEAGVKVDWGPVTTTLAAFQIAQPSTLAITDPAGGLPTLALDGEQRNRGIELNAYGELFRGVRLLGGVTFLDAIRTKTGNAAFDGARAASAPRFRAVIGGEWDTPFLEGVTLTGRVTYSSDAIATNSRPDLTVPAWTTVDLGARYTFNSAWNDKPITVNFNVDNVFDKSYWKPLWPAGLLYQGAPRTFRLSTTFNF